MTGRVLSTASLLIDWPVTVGHLPDRGGDVLGQSSGPTPGGGFNIVAAAARQGVEVGLLCPLGTGPNGDLGRRALKQEGVSHVGPTHPKDDTGFCLALVEPDGERTFVTVPGAESRVQPDDLSGSSITPGDAIFVSGYDLCYPVSGAALAPWIAGLERGVLVVFDPGPLVREIPADRLAAVLARCDICTLNEREATLLWGVDLAGRTDVRDLARGVPGSARGDGIGTGMKSDATVLLRVGPAGTVILEDRVTSVPSIQVDVVDATGAGDAHSGVLMARLLAGDRMADAVRTANLAAAVAVTRFGPATAPTRDELEEVSRRHRWSAQPETTT